MKETRVVIYQVTADKSGYSSYSQERIPLTRCSRWKRNCTYKHSSVFSIWTLWIYKFYFQLMYYWQWASVNTKSMLDYQLPFRKWVRAPLPPSPSRGGKKPDPRELRKSSLNKKNTRMKKMFILSLTQVQGCQPPTSSNINDL